eukprot:g15872.t1
MTRRTTYGRPKSAAAKVTFARGLATKNPDGAAWLEPSEARKEDDETDLLTLTRSINGAPRMHQGRETLKT